MEMPFPLVEISKRVIWMNCNRGKEEKNNEHSSIQHRPPFTTDNLK